MPGFWGEVRGDGQVLRRAKRAEAPAEEGGEGRVPEDIAAAGQEMSAGFEGLELGRRVHGVTC